MKKILISLREPILWWFPKRFFILSWGNFVNIYDAFSFFMVFTSSTFSTCSTSCCCVDFCTTAEADEVRLNFVGLLAPVGRLTEFGLVDVVAAVFFGCCCCCCCRRCISASSSTFKARSCNKIKRLQIIFYILAHKWRNFVCIRNISTCLFRT